VKRQKGRNGARKYNSSFTIKTGALLSSARLPYLLLIRCYCKQLDATCRGNWSARYRYGTILYLEMDLAFGFQDVEQLRYGYCPLHIAGK